MSLNIGTLHGILDLDTKPFDKGIKEASKGPGLLSSVAGKAFGAVKTAAKVSGAAIVAGIGTALVKGWGRLTAIDDAQAKLKGLGHSAESVETVMDSALKSVKGTAFGLGDAATIAAGAVASGVKPGKDLTRTLKLVGDAATIGGTSLADMGSIFNKVAATGKVQGDVIAQLGDKGIPILQLLGKQIGKTPEETAKLASQGKIDFETFQKAMEEGLGGAALKSGDTLKGAFANMWAAVGRFGEKLLVGVAPVIKDVFGGLTDWLDKIGNIVEPWADKVADAITGVFSILFKGDFDGPILGLDENSTAIRVLFTIRDVVKGLPDTFKRVWDAAKPFLESIGGRTLDKAKSIFEKLSSAAETLWPAIKDVATWAAMAVGAIAVTAWNVALDVFDALAGIVANVLAPALAGLVDWIKDNETFVLMLVAAVGAGVAAFKLWEVGGKAVTAVTKAWKAAQTALSAVVQASPIMIAVIAIAALVAAAVIAYKRVGWFRDAVDKVAAFFKNTFGPILKTVAGWVTDTLWPALKSVGEWLADTFMSAVRGVADLWTNTLWPALQAVASFVTDTLWPALQDLGGYIGDVMKPIIQGLSDTWNNALQPALSLVAGILTGVVWPIVKKVAEFIKAYFMVHLNALALIWSNVLWPALKKVAEFISRNVLPVLGKITEKIIDVASWVGRKIGEIVGFVVGIPGKIGSTISTLWDGLKNGITAAKDWVSDKITAIVDVAKGIGRRLSGLADIIKAPFKAAFNGVAAIWNSTLGKVSFHIPGWVPGVGGKGFSFPTMPTMHTGGVVRAGSGEGSEVLRLLKVGETVRTARQESDLRNVIASLSAAAAAGLAGAAASRRVSTVADGRTSGVIVPVTFAGPVAGRDGERWVADTITSAVRRGLLAS